MDARRIGFRRRSNPLRHTGGADRLIAVTPGILKSSDGDSATSYRVGSRGAMVMRWHDLLFLHWPIEPITLQALLPHGLLVDTFQGQAWVGVVPFTMSGIRARRAPPIPGLSAFPELNVRTYVTPAPGLVIPGRGGAAIRPGPGVWFFSLDAASRVAVRVARSLFHLNYRDARMSARHARDGWIEYSSRRLGRTDSNSRFEARYRAVGAANPTQPGTLEHFLTERYWLYAADRRGAIYAGRVWHDPWRLCAAEAEVRENSMAVASGITLPSVAPLMHFAKELCVDAALPRRLAQSARVSEPLGPGFRLTSRAGIRAVPFWHGRERPPA